MENVVHRVVPWAPVNQVIQKKVDSLAKLQDFAKHLPSKLIRDPSLTGPITHLVRWPSQVTSADESSFYSKRGSCQPWWTSDSSVCLERHVPRSLAFIIRKRKKLKKKMSCSLSKSSESSRSMCRKCESVKQQSEDYKVNRHKKRVRGVEMIKPRKCISAKPLTIRTTVWWSRPRNIMVIFQEMLRNRPSVWMCKWSL